MRYACWCTDGPKAAGRAFDACAARLPEFAHDPELDALARFWLDQARAWYDVRRRDPAAAEARLRRSMDQRDAAGAGAWLRPDAYRADSHRASVAARAGGREAPGRRRSTAPTPSWRMSTGSAATCRWAPAGRRKRRRGSPADLAAAMTRRVAGEVGTILGGLDQEHSAGALDRLPVLERLPPDVHDEVTGWASIERAWAEGRTDDFLARVVPYLAAGRRETCLWYAVLLDLCRTAPRAAPARCGSVLRGGGRSDRGRSRGAATAASGSRGADQGVSRRRALGRDDAGAAVPSGLRGPAAIGASSRCSPCFATSVPPTNTPRPRRFAPSSTTTGAV